MPAPAGWGIFMVQTDAWEGCVRVLAYASHRDYRAALNVSWRFGAACEAFVETTTGSRSPRRSGQALSQRRKGMFSDDDFQSGRRRRAGE